MNFKKYFFLLSTSLFCGFHNAYSYDGVIIVLEAPLLREPRLDSTVVQTLRKGERVFIPNESVVDGLLPEFTPTFDRTGNRAYIPSRYVKPILHTMAESRMPITLAGHDPTDYRLEEPIPATYPFLDRSFLRASVSFLVGSNSSTPYSYNSAYDTQDYAAQMGARFTYTQKVEHDKYDRFYFGAIGFATIATNTIAFKNASTAKENLGVVRAGPWLTYDTYKTERLRLTFGTGFTFNYHFTNVLIDQLGVSEERSFTGFSISPVAGSNFQFSDVFPNTDFIGGVDVSLFLPHTLKTSKEALTPALWGDNGDTIKSGLKAQASLFFGVQVKY